MSFRTMFRDRLVQSGLWPKEAEAVMDFAKEHPLLDAMKYRWEEFEDDYQGRMAAHSVKEVVWISLKAVADEWLEKNKPMHFARPLFKVGV